MAKGMAEKVETAPTQVTMHADAKSGRMERYGAQLRACWLQTMYDVTAVFVEVYLTNVLIIITCVQFLKLSNKLLVQNFSNWVYSYLQDHYQHHINNSDINITLLHYYKINSEHTVDHVSSTLDPPGPAPFRSGRDS